MQPGPVEIRAAAAASPRARRVTVAGTASRELAANDRVKLRRASGFWAFCASTRPSLYARLTILLIRVFPSTASQGRLAPEEPAASTCRGHVGEPHAPHSAPRDNRLNVLVNGKTVVSRAVKAGGLELRAAIAPSSGPRQIKLRWANSASISNEDPRQAAALLQQIEVGSPQPPKALLNVPEDLAKPNVSSSGIDKDGWLRRTRASCSRAGRAGTLRSVPRSWPGSRSI